eukprot:TRINITY_DN2059_c4_g1_i2.p1 TRINITY_DN2059_c4_g1~~TRINITY_DN2059_c4_g1_i2.p1  ORF type:complete len:195 (+),score=21.59 TRINITY_DN2059_c4_g1_i2:117-701(+)
MYNASLFLILYKKVWPNDPKKNNRIRHRLVANVGNYATNTWLNPTYDTHVCHYYERGMEWSSIKTIYTILHNFHRLDSWSPRSHYFFPEESRTVAFNYFLLWINEDSPFSLLPFDVLCIIIRDSIGPVTFSRWLKDPFYKDSWIFCQRDPRGVSKDATDLFLAVLPDVEKKRTALLRSLKRKRENEDCSDPQKK